MDRVCQCLSAYAQMCVHVWLRVDVCVFMCRFVLVCAVAACCAAPKLKRERNVLEGDDKSEVNQSFPEGSGQMCCTQSLRILQHISA